MELEQVSRFFGSRNSYVAIAKRGKERIGISVVYTITSIGTGGLRVRFVAYPTSELENSAFTHFKPIENAEFTKVDGTKFTGIRLNRVFIPVLYPIVNPYVFVEKLDEWLIFPIVSDWITERCKEEGFEILPEVKLEEVIKGLVKGYFDQKDNLKFVFELPSLEEKNG